MFRVLVLDDSPERLEAFAKSWAGCQLRRVSTSKDARIALLDEEPFDLVCLDHDLGESRDGVDPGDGMEVAQFIARDMRGKIPRWVLVHSSNVPAAGRMFDVLDDAMISVVLRYPYSTRMLKDLSGWIVRMSGIPRD